ncbi:MAG TPA: OmpA family protein [Cyclobacteriaceae bacterium]|nr:OmpA family protein [Cyclobacteriaceae bacterium]
MKKITTLLLLCLAVNYLIFARQSSSETSRELTLIGTVYDGDTQKPMEASVVIEVPDFNPLSVKTDAKGRFAVGVPSHYKCIIKASAEGFETLRHKYSFHELKQADSILRLNLYLVPIEKVKMKGDLLSSKDNVPLTCELKVHHNSDFSTEDTSEVFTGSYSKTLTKLGWYILEFSSPGFLPVSDTVWVANYKRRTIRKDFYLKPVEMGLTVQLRNVYFNFAQATLAPESNGELDKVAEFFLQNPSLQFEIAGHTDSEGPEDYNLRLSQDRAQAIADYLISKGVDSSQLIVHGYGESKPIDSNQTSAGKLNNRRVEFIVASNMRQ